MKEATMQHYSRPTEKSNNNIEHYNERHRKSIYSGTVEPYLWMMKI